MKNISLLLPPHSIRSLSLKAIIPASLLCFHLGLAGATVVVSENFEAITDSAALSNHGWYSVNTNFNGAAWSLQTPSTPPSPITGNAVRSSSGSAKNTYLIKQWDVQTLTAVGHSITLGFDYFGNHSEPGQQFSLSLFQTSTILTDAHLYDYGDVSTKKLVAPDPINDAVGYGFAREDSENPDADLAAWLFSESAGGATSVGSLDTSLFDLTVAPNLFDNVAHTIVFRITKVADGARIDYMVDGNLIATATDTSATGDLSFNSLKLNGDLQGYYDNIQVVTAIPEPTTFALLLGMGAFGVLAVRSRRR